MSPDANANDVLGRFRPLFEPKAIAIVGASNGNRTRANDVLEFTRAMGFAGPIYPIHPSAAEIDGLRAYRQFSDCPTEIDYAFVAIGATKVPELLATAQSRVRYAQIMASGFGETPAGEELNRRMLDVARQNRMRLIGPNCLGTYSPRGRLSYIRDCPAEPGSVGLISQSGGACVTAASSRSAIARTSLPPICSSISRPIHRPGSSACTSSRSAMAAASSRCCGAGSRANRW